jgi:hypothetical protein
MTRAILIAVCWLTAWFAPDAQAQEFPNRPITFIVPWSAGGTERKIGAVGHDKPHRAVEAGAHGLVAQHIVADIDLAGRRSLDPNDFVFDDGGFADALLRQCRC